MIILSNKLIKSTEDSEKILDGYLRENPEIAKGLKLYNISKKQILENMGQNIDSFTISTYSSAD